MKTNFIKILLVLPIFFFACSEKKDSSGGLDIFTSDDTEEAVKLVDEANEKLKEIKLILKENESRLEDLKTAMGAKDSAKVKTLSGELADEIKIGTQLGQQALGKIDEAQALNINEDFRNYLGLKARSLLKYAEAYNERRQLAELLRDNYDPNNAEQRKFVAAEFERKEVVFLEIMKDAGDLSRQANQLAKDANSKKKS